MTMQDATSAYTIEQRDADLVGTTASILYRLAFHKAARHLIHVTVRVERCSGIVALVMPSWTPGSYKIRDYAGWQGNVRAFAVGASGRTALPHRWTDKARLEVDMQGADVLEVDYVVYCNERTVRTNHVNRFHAFVMPTATCMYVEGRMHEIHHVELQHDQATWPNVSTALSPVRAARAGSVLLGALNYDILADSPIEIGSQSVVRFDVNGVPHEVAIAGNHALDTQWLANQLAVVVGTESAVFGGLPYDRYVFIVQAYPGIYGGLEHARSSVNAVDPSTLLDPAKCNELLALLCHEYFHLWNVKRIRPIELGPFDYTREAYSPMLWLAEGLTSYYDDLFAYRCGFHTQEAFIKLLAREHIAKLARVPGRFQMSVRDSSYLAWLKLYMQSPDGNNRFPSYYLKGGVIFLLLDLYIIDHTDGKRSLDDALRALWSHYQSNPGVGLTESDCIALIERGTGVQCKALIDAWLSGTDELPYDEMLGLAGLAVQSQTSPTTAKTFGEQRSFASVPPTAWCGWTVREEQGKLVVKGVEDGSPADAANIGIDDEIIAVDGRRVTAVNILDTYLAEFVGRTVAITAHCDGRLYTTTIEPQAQTTLAIVDVAKPTARQNNVRKAWLRR